jgi:antitoxin YefM
MTHTLPISKAREELADLVENAKKRLDEYIITVNGSPAAVIISAAEYESWKETEEILADKELMKAIKQGEKDIEEGNVYDWDDVKKELKLDVQS